ncbi:MAG: arabinose ABC transporter substrate-binding protein [Spirochaetes bacterium]|nr:MAG: arabinose ABC transporter substrate-binding protein [Spirochaetota bacterium]
MKRIYAFLLVMLIALSITGALFANGGSESGDKPVKIGFLVKMPEEPWFQNEWKFAEEAGVKYGFEVVKIGTPDGEKVLSAIDNLAAQGAQGFVICTPDVNLGPAIKSKADAVGLKVLAVDDRFLGPDGEPMEDVPYMGISAYKIGRQVGETMMSQMEERGWKQEDTGFLRVSFNELPTAKSRTDGMTDALKEAGFDEAYIFESPEKTTDTEGGFNAANITLTKHPEIKHWMVGGLNDESAMGGTRALEGRGFGVEDICAVGIGGSGTATNEFAKTEMTGFYATALISPYRHGFETSEFMYKWIVDGVEPPATTFTTAIMINRDNYEEIMAKN